MPRKNGWSLFLPDLLTAVSCTKDECPRSRFWKLGLYELKVRNDVLRGRVRRLLLAEKPIFGYLRQAEDQLRPREWGD
jgi:hypothetical protein